MEAKSNALDPSNFSLNARDSSALAQLADALRRHNYTPYGLFEALGEDPGTVLKRVDLPLHLRRLHDTPLHHLIRLFLLGTPVEREALAFALAPLAPETLVELGLARAENNSFASAYRLMVFEELYLVSDLFLHGDTLRPDFVTGVNNTSINLAALTIRRSGRALDLGTGCGVQALLASRHCDQIIATDVNPRALEIAKFNAALNGVTNVEWRVGSLFEPVTDEQFDLIVCNPPYVISPQTDYIFRNAGLRGDAVSQKVVAESPRHLRAGGFAIALCDWIHTAEESWWLPLEQWVANTDCNALFLCHRTADPLTYAAGWTRQPAPPDAATLDRMLNEWLAYYAELGIRSISGGAVVLRKSTGAHWTHAEILPGSPLGNSGAQIERMFSAQDFLRTLPDERALLDVVLAPTDGRIDQTLKYREGEWRVDAMRWRMIQGLGFEGQLDSLAIHLVTSFDGQQPLRAIIARAAINIGADPKEIRHDALTLARRWIEVGFLAPVK